MELMNTSAIVTGAASGLGRAAAEALSKRGVLVHGLDLPQSVEKSEPLDGVVYVPTDVTDPEQVAAALAQTNASGMLRVVVNCAGIAPASRIVPRGAAPDLALFARVVMVNLIGSYNVLALAAQAIAKTTPSDGGQRGVIVNTASVAAFDGQIGQAAYGASKGGIVSLTLPAARDLASHGIRVCTVAPGIVDTPDDGVVLGRGAFRAGRRCPVPAPAGPPGRVRPARALDRGERLPERRSHSARRCDPHGTAVVVCLISPQQTCRVVEPSHSKGSPPNRPRTSAACLGRHTF